MTYQIFLPLCSASTDSLQILSCWTWSCCSAACSSALLRAAVCASTGLPGWVLPRDRDGAEAACPRGVVAACQDLVLLFLLNPEPFPNTSILRLTLSPVLLGVLGLPGRLNLLLFALSELLLSQHFLLAADLECFKKMNIDASTDRQCLALFRFPVT